MDFLREQLRELYGNQVACYSGRGGELWHDGQWTVVPKEVIKTRFREGDIKILLCTESASEGLKPADLWGAVQLRPTLEPHAGGAAHWPD